MWSSGTVANKSEATSEGAPNAYRLILKAVYQTRNKRVDGLKAQGVVANGKNYIKEE